MKSLFIYLFLDIRGILIAMAEKYCEKKLVKLTYSQMVQVAPEKGGRTRKCRAVSKPFNILRVVEFPFLTRLILWFLYELFHKA